MLRRMSKQPLGALMLALAWPSIAAAQLPPSATFPVVAAAPAPAAPTAPAAPVAVPVPQAPASGGGSREQVAFNLFEQGRREWQAGHYAEAAALLIASHDQNALPMPLLLLADCYERLGRLHSARDTFLRAAALASQHHEVDLAHRAETRAAALAPRVPRLELRVPQPAPPGLVVTLNGGPVAPGLLNTPLPMDAAVHRVEARAPGHEPLSLSVSVGNELAQSQQVKVVPLELRLVPETLDRRELAWWVGGAGAVVGVAGLVVAAVALSKDNGQDRDEKEEARWLAKWLGTGSALISIPALGTAAVLLYTAEAPLEPSAVGVRWDGTF